MHLQIFSHLPRHYHHLNRRNVSKLYARALLLMEVGVFPASLQLGLVAVVIVVANEY